VCFWNANAARSEDDAWQPQSACDRPWLTDLWRHSDEVLGPILAHSAMSYTGIRGIRRNIAVALGNSGSVEAAASLAEPDDRGLTARSDGRQPMSSGRGSACRRVEMIG